MTNKMISDISTKSFNRRVDRHTELAITRFETLVTEAIIGAGVADRAAAIELLKDGTTDIEYFSYQHGLPSNYLTDADCTRAQIEIQATNV